MCCTHRHDKKLYRIHWLEVRIRDMHELIISEGKRKFDHAAVEAIPATEHSEAIEAKPEVQFHWSWWYTTKVRPFFVKDAGRDVCVCIYHLRFDLFVEAIFNYVKRLRCDLKVCNCQHSYYKSSIDFRRAHACVRTSSDRYDDVACVSNKCSSCSDLKLFKICECEARSQLPPIKAQVYEKVEYRCKDGTVKEKKDFVPREMPYSEFEALLIKYWPKLMMHHDTGKWQDDETSYLKSHVER